jgi:hypothetical protein
MAFIENRFRNACSKTAPKIFERLQGLLHCASINDFCPLRYGKLL